MTIATSVTLDFARQTSTFHYTISGGIDRTLEYSNDGFIALPAVEVAIATPLDDFESLVTAVSNWIALLATQFKLPLTDRASIDGTARSIGAASGTTWACQSAVSFRGPDNGTMDFIHTPGSGVTLTPRPALRITYANLVYRNLAAFDLIAAARTGLWPQPGQSHTLTRAIPSGPAGGVLAGSYPDPAFAVDMATQAELDAGLAIRVLTTDPRLSNARASALPYALPVRVVTASTTIVPASDYTIAVNTTAGVATVTLPPTPANGERYEVIRIVGNNQLTINRNGQNIDGGTTNPTVQVKHSVRVTFVAGWGWVTADSAAA